MGTILLGVLILTIASGVQMMATSTCKKCVIKGKQQRAMFRTHSDACLPQSGVDPKLVELLLQGELREDPLLKKHVYCVLLSCKLISKDGKLQKTALTDKMPTRSGGKNATKTLEHCAVQDGDSPEELAWNLFRCGFDKKALIFNYMPISAGPSN